MAEEATKKFEAKISKLGDEIASLSLKEAVDLADYMKDTYSIEPAAGGAVMMAAAPGAGGEAAAEEEQVEFDVILESSGEKKIQVIKAVRELTGLGLREAKELVEGAPAPVRQAVTQEDANQAKQKLEEAGATVELT